MKGFLKITLTLLPLSLLLFLGNDRQVFAQDIFWSTPQKISQSATHTLMPTVASDSKGYVHSVWMEMPDNTVDFYVNRPNPGIFYSFWNGDTWSSPQRINSQLGWADAPSITITSNDYVHVVWEEDSTSECDDGIGCTQIYYSYYNGSSWSSPVSISSSLHQASVSWELSPKIASDSANNLYVIFAAGNESTVGTLLYYTKYNGLSWSTPAEISQGLHDVGWPDLAVDTSGNVHVLLWDTCNGCYQQGGIYYTVYNGSTWSPATKISASQGDNDWSKFPRLVIDGSGALHAAWYNVNSTFDIKVEYARKPSGGSWSSPFAVSTTVANAYWGTPLIGLTVDNSNNAYVGWGQYNSTSYPDIQCTPGPEITDPQDPNYPGCIADNNYCACGGYGVDAMYRKYTVSTDTWSTPNIVRSTKYLDAPTIWRDKWWNQHFVWSEINPTTNQWEFWYSEVPANVGSYNSSQMTITMEVTGDTLKIPNNALASNATISAQIGPVPSSADPLVTTIPRSYTFRPHGTTFISPKVATATILYSDAELIGSDERNLKAYIWDATLNSGAGGWTSNSFSQSTNTATNKLTATLPHFSLYGIQAPKIQAQFQSPPNPYFGSSIPLSYKFINLVTGQPADPPAQRTIMVENEDGTTTPAPFWDEYKAKLVDSEGTLIETLSYDAGQGSLGYDTATSTYTGTFSGSGLAEGDYTIEVYLASTIPVSSQTFHFNPNIKVTFLPPLKDDTLYSLKDGSTLPVKFTLTYENGTWVETPTLPEDVIVVIRDSGGVEKARYLFGTGGDNVRYDPTTNQYIANVHTKELGLGIGEYKIEVLVKGQAQAQSQSPTGSTVFQLAEPGKVKSAFTP